MFQVDLAVLKAGGEGDNSGWDGWMASLTPWTWVWASSGSWWWTGKPGLLPSMGLQRVGHYRATELNWSSSNKTYDEGSQAVFWMLKGRIKTNPEGKEQSKWYDSNILCWGKCVCVCVCVCVHAHACMLIAQPCSTLCKPMDCSPPGFSVHGILQARTLEWIAITFFRGSSPPYLHCRQILYCLGHHGRPPDDIPSF